MSAKTLDNVAPDAAATREVVLCGVHLAPWTEAQCIEHVLQSLDGGRGGWIVTPNLDILRNCHRDPSVRELVGSASVRVADGMPLVWTAWIQGTRLPARVAGSNLISSLSTAAAERGRSIFMLGGDPGTAELAAGVLLQRSPSLRVVGTCCPPRGFEHDEQEMARLIDAVVQARPDIVFVALGSPKQERLIYRIRDRLPGAWWVGVGISFSFLSGRVARAPRWMQKTGLEWLHRLFQEPRRLARRYLVEDAPFAASLLFRTAMTRMLGRSDRDSPDCR
jgi:N-acetylglucosaminyldiphosphoundecaprenol N-acetyl-beta-D-mannosaminyltransferase